MQFMYDKLVIVKRHSSTLGEYNRPQKELNEVGRYECHTAENSTNVAQKQPQKVNTEDLDLYTYPEADIQLGDVLYIYELDEYEKLIPESEYRALADKPYKKRTQLKVPLLRNEEV